MKKYSLNILSFFLILIFTIPIFVLGFHDIFEHEAHTYLSDSSNDTVSDIDNEICYLHKFKFYSFDFPHIQVQDYLIPDHSFIVSTYFYIILQSKPKSYYYLRGPPL